jgi:hypothetical protein
MCQINPKKNEIEISILQSDDWEQIPYFNLFDESSVLQLKDAKSK